MPQPFIKKAFKAVKIVVLTIVALVGLILLAPYVFPGKISAEIKKLANNSLTTELNFSKARLSFLNHFPSLTLTLYDCSLMGSAPYEKDTLVQAKEVALGINLPSLLSKKINVNEIYLTEAFIKVLVDADGKPNYNVYKSVAAKANTAKDSSDITLKIEKIIIEKSSIIYDDRVLPMYLNATGFEYKGEGDLSKAVFDLKTHAEVAAIDFMYAGRSFFVSKKLQADLITKINTNSLSLLFEKNDLKINRLPFDFKGKFEFLKEGYNMQFKLNSNATALHDLFTALPPEYLTWLDRTELKGIANISAELAGKFISSTNTMPDLVMTMGIRNGYIANDKTPSPVKNLFLNFDAHLPGLNPDSLYVNVDSIFFNIDKDYFSSVILLKGLKEPYIKAKINSEIDLAKWDKALGIKPFDVKGLWKIHATAEGKYATAVKKKLRTTDTVISSISNFTISSSLSNGYFKYTSLPQPVTNLAFTVNASCTDNKYQHSTIDIDGFNANVLANYVKGFLHVKGGNSWFVDADIKSKFNLADVKKFYPLDSLELKGNLLMDVVSKGSYNPSKNSFPRAVANVQLKDGLVQTKYYPNPIEKINTEAVIVNNTGTLKGMKVDIKPISIEFEKQPFFVRANLQNFDDLRYNIASKGTLDIGRIYKVFAVDGIHTTGFVETNLSLKGTQSDAMKGLYDKLQNKGTMKVKDMSVSYEMFPKPFHIQTGLFRFDQDKMWFDKFNASYGKTKFALDGNLQNVINYVMQSKSLLHGNFNLNSNLIAVDEFMAFADTKKASPSAQSGVIIIPSNLDVNFVANAKQVLYNGLKLDSAKGNMSISNGKLILKETGFIIIGARAVMDATYTSLTPKKALFDYHMKAEEFDVNRAYREIKLFHDLASSAAKAQGIVSLDYTVKGRLNADMMPVYPSLEGGGVLSVKQVKLKGLKLFNAISKETNRDSISNPDISKVDFKTTIKSNIITLERTKMRTMGFRPRIEGQVSFDGKLNLKFRLGLPPLGIFGIPMTITGTQSNPKINLGRGKKEDELQEQAEKEEN